MKKEFGIECLPDGERPRNWRAGTQQVLHRLRTFFLWDYWIRSSRLISCNIGPAPLSSPRQIDKCKFLRI
jgi:hypothetical protein